LSHNRPRLVWPHTYSWLIIRRRPELRNGIELRVLFQLPA